MGKIGTKLQYVHSAARLFGPSVGMISLSHQLTHRDATAYYAKLVEASWNRFMKDIPFDAGIIDTLPESNDGPIWVMWWQGLDGSEPAIVHACVDSIRRHANGRDVRIITKDTISQYASMDPSIMRKVCEGKITLTTLSDVVRFAVLEEHGGMWMDATMYLTADLADDIRKHPFYSIPNHEIAPTRNWTGYFMGGVKGNPLFTLMTKAFTAMYAKVARTPDYFMIDVMLSAAYTHIPSVRTMIDSVPANNLHRFFIAQHLGSSHLQLPEDTYAYKLSYKNMDEFQSMDGDTLYQAVIGGIL